MCARLDDPGFSRNVRGSTRKRPNQNRGPRVSDLKPGLGRSSAVPEARPSDDRLGRGVVQLPSMTGSLGPFRTTFATVGFGDIAASAVPARIVVIVQIVTDLIVLGVILRVLLGAARVGTQLRRERGGTEH